VRKILSPRRVADVPNLSNDWGQRARNMGKGKTLALASEFTSSLWVVQHDRGPIGSLKLHGRRGSQKGPKHSRRTLVGKMPGSRRGGQVLIGSQLGKGPIESGISDGSE